MDHDHAFNMGSSFRPKDTCIAESTTSRQESEMASENLKELQAVGTSGDPVERLRLLCLSRGANGFLGLGRLLRRKFEDGEKYLNKDEFVLGLRNTCMEITDDEAQVLFDKFYDYENGGVNLSEFLVHIRPPLSESRTKVLGDAFNKMDRDSDGLITIKDFKRVYNVNSQTRYISGEDSEDTIVKQFLSNFEADATKDGKITHEEFLNYYAAISASFDNDCYFDLMIRQAYKL